MLKNINIFIVRRFCGNLPEKMPRFQDLCKIISIGKNSFYFEWISLLDLKLY